MSTDTKALVRATVRGTIWEYISRYSAKLFVFISTVILARVLSKEDFGVASYAIVAINFFEFLQGLGLRQALVYYPKNEKQNNTAFWLSISSGLILFVVSLFIVSPFVGNFYNDARAVPVTQVLSFYFVLISLTVVQESSLSKKLAFGQRSIPIISNSFFKGLTSISLAFLGYGAWSLIYGQLIGTFVEVVGYWVITKWRPAFQFEKRFVRPLLSYGLNIFSISALSNLLSNIDYFLIGRYLGAEVLGVYTLAFRLPELFVKEFSAVLGKVIFPVFTKIKDDLDALRRSFLVSLEYVNLVTVPIGLGLAVVGRWVILVFFGQKWIDAVPVMVAVSVLSVLRAMVFNIGNTYKAMGRPDLVTKINFWQMIVTLPLLWWGITQIQTITAIAWIQVAIIFVFGIVKLIIVVNILKINYIKILKALQPSLLAGIFMSLIVYGVVQLVSGFSPIFILSVGVLTGAITYLLALLTFHREGTLKAVARIKTGITKKK